MKTTHIPYSSPQKIRLALLGASFSALISCGGSGQDDGTTSQQSLNISGVVIDGYLARTTIFADTNNNGTLDPWEPFAFTDNQGYYSYNPVTDTDYCAASASPQQQQYCLQINADYENVVIRIDSGYDVLTGEPFIGQMSRRIYLDNQDDLVDTVISPMTSLLTDVQTETERTTLLTQLNIEDTDLNINYLDTDGQGTINSQLLNSALKIHKTVSVLSDRLTDTYTELGESRGTPNDATSLIYPNLAQQLISTETSLEIGLRDPTLLTNVLDNAEQSIRDTYTQRDYTLPNDLGSLDNTTEFDRVVTITRAIPDIIDTLIDTTVSDLTLEEARGSASALEAVVIKSTAETSTDPSIDNAINFFNQTDNAQLIQALTDTLSGDNADIAGLANNNFDTLVSIDDVVQAAQLADDVTPFASVANKQLKVSDLDLGTSPDNLKDVEVELYFDGQTGDTDGSFDACIKFIDGASSDGSLGEANTRGELVNGFWSMLGATESTPNTYSLLLTISFLGATYQAIMKPAGTETISDIEYQLIRFDNDGDIGQWHSADGIIDKGDVPTTNAQCQQRLPSRIGL